MIRVLLLCILSLCCCFASQPTWADQFDPPAVAGQLSGTVEGKINWPHNSHTWLMIWVEKITPETGDVAPFEPLKSLPQGLKINVTWDGVNADQNQVDWIKTSKIGDRYAFKVLPTWDKTGVRMVAIPTPLAPKTQAPVPNAALQNAGATTQNARGDFYKSLHFQEFNAFPSGHYLLGDGDEISARDALYVVNQNGAAMTMERIAVSGQRFKSGVRLVVPRNPEAEHIEYWWSYLRADANAPVREGDAMWLTFWARSGNGQPAKFSAAVKHDTNDVHRSRAQGGHLQDAMVGSEWKQFMMPLRARNGDKPRFELYANYRAQTLEIGGFAWANFGQNVSFENLPRAIVDLNYKGRDVNAPWRQAALERIEKLRKAPLKITVLDKNGQPLEGATIEVRQTRSEFRFGAAVASHMFPGNWPPTDGGGYSNLENRHRSADPGPVGHQYRQLVRDNFDIVVTGFGWRYWESPNRFRPQVLEHIQMWRDMGIDVKNHVLLYPREDVMPDRVVKMNRQDATQALWDYVDAAIPATAENVTLYDVMNEPFGSVVYQKKFGDNQDAYFQMQADLFNRVKKLAPNSKTILNDAGQDMSDEQLEKFLNWAKRVTDKGGKIDEFGVQAHVGLMAPPEEILKRFDRLSANGQTLNISEFDVKIGERKTPATQAYEADVLRDYLILAFSHPKVTHFIMWGFWDGDHWLGNAPLFNLDWSPKPAYAVWKDLVLTKWRTNETAQTGKDGTATIRGFKGDYDVKVSVGGKTKTAKTSIGKNGVLTVKLP